MEHPFHRGEQRFSTDGLAGFACQTRDFASMAPRPLREMTQPADLAW